jgi:hypothetical protein
MDGCVAYPHWEACSSCLNFHPQNGCNVQELDGFYVENGDFIICGDYEEGCDDPGEGGDAQQ